MPGNLEGILAVTVGIFVQGSLEGTPAVWGSLEGIPAVRGSLEAGSTPAVGLSMVEEHLQNTEIHALWYTGAGWL